MRLRIFLFSLALAAAVLGSIVEHVDGAAAVSPDFAYRQITVRVTAADDRPVAGASIYGFCRELNLIWPRRDHEAEGRNDIVWHESFLGKTGADGAVKVDIPPGKWRFFAAGVTQQGAVVASWTDSRERAAGDVVRLAPMVTKHWTFCSSEGEALRPAQILIKPDEFPIWIPIRLPPAADGMAIEVSGGSFQLWAAGDVAPDRPGFALAMGTLSDKTADGKITSPDKAAVVECKGGKGKAVLSWTRRENFGLQGDVALCNDAKVLLSPGNFTLAYRRPIGDGLTATFIGQLYRLQRNQSLRFDLDTPLVAGMDQELSKLDKKEQRKLIAQLYLVDGNGHLLGELLDSSHKLVSFGAAVTLNGSRFTARSVASKGAPAERNSQEEVEDTGDPDADTIPFAPRWGQTLFRASIGDIDSEKGASWEFTAPLGVMPQSTLTKSPRVLVTSATFKMEVPKVIEQDAKNLLAQAEMLAVNMEKASARKRKRDVTTITIGPSHVGAVSTHDGTATAIGTRLFYSDQPMSAHGIVHETGHNFDFYHGGLHESVVEVCRCAGGEQISQQPGKWRFLDLMNGRTAEPERPYLNVGLYLYCYAQGGPNFLHWMSANEPVVLGKLAKDNYTRDELTTALLSLGLGRDMTSICHTYGLEITPERMAAVLPVVKSLCVSHK